MDSLIGSKFFLKLDLRSGYWHAELKKEDKHKTAFTVGPLGFYECNRMPFGLTNAPATLYISEVDGGLYGRNAPQRMFDFS